MKGIWKSLCTHAFIVAIVIANVHCHLKVILLLRKFPYYIVPHTSFQGEILLMHDNRQALKLNPARRLGIQQVYDVDRVMPSVVLQYS